MSLDDAALQVVVTISPKARNGRKAGPKVPDPPRIPRIARLMALAIKFQEMVDRGEVRDYADLARLGFVSRARITQLMNLLSLASDIQEELLFASSNAPPERTLRHVISEIHWAAQRKLWEQLAPKGSRTRSLG